MIDTTTTLRAKTGFAAPDYVRTPKPSGSIYLVKASVCALHRSTSGVSMAKIDKGPTSYAQQLARYIRDPSTIRARTMNEWGRTPSFDEIKGFIAEHQAERAAFRAEADSLGECERDAADFTVRPWADAVNFQIAHEKCKANVIDFVPPTFVPARDAFGPSEIIAGVANLMKCSVADILGKSKDGQFAKARHIICHVLRARGWSLPQIGRRLGRDHSTVHSSLRRFDEKADDRMRWVAAQFVRVAKSEAT